MRPGDVVWVDFGIPAGSEPGFVRPAILVTAELVLRSTPRTVHVVPTTTNLARGLPTEVPVHAEGLVQPSAAQAHLCTVISTERITRTDIGNIGSASLAQIRSLIADLLDLP